MEFDHSKYQERYRIKSCRLPNFNYSANGSYFVTICTKNKRKYFGEIKEKKLIPTKIGEVAIENLKNTTKQFPFVTLDCFVVMPNHIHAVIIIDQTFNFRNVNDSSNKTGGCTGKYQIMGKSTLGEIIRWYKGVCTFKIHRAVGIKGFAWQGNYYEHIVRTDMDLDRIRKYILNNPKKWNEDRFYEL